jgi:hypothetical protein
MAVLTKPQALAIVRRAHGPDVAESLARHLPDRIDIDNPADVDLLFRLGLTRDRLMNALGAEL